MQINPSPDVSRRSLNVFDVKGVLKGYCGLLWDHPVFTSCDYCHKELTVHVHAPLNVPKFAKDEACRVAKIHHLRTEHITRKPRDKTTN
jgi:hypothetical protein